MKVDQKILVSAKVAFFVYILISPFFNYTHVSFMNNMFIKILMLGIIIAASFVDLQLAIIMTLAFLVLIINLNKDVIFGIKQNMPMITLSTPLVMAEMPVMNGGPGMSGMPGGPVMSGMPGGPVMSGGPGGPGVTGVSEHFSVNVPIETDNLIEFPDKCDKVTKEKGQISNNLYDLYIDPKIKPYEMYIRQLSNPSTVDEASESKILGWN
jgi:hypothetical protein